MAKDILSQGGCTVDVYTHHIDSNVCPLLGRLRKYHKEYFYHLFCRSLDFHSLGH